MTLTKQTAPLEFVPKTPDITSLPSPIQSPNDAEIRRDIMVLLEAVCDELQQAGRQFNFVPTDDIYLCGHFEGPNDMRIHIKRHVGGSLAGRIEFHAYYNHIDAVRLKKVRRPKPLMTSASVTRAPNLIAHQVLSKLCVPYRLELDRIKSIANDKATKSGVKSASNAQYVPSILQETRQMPDGSLHNTMSSVGNVLVEMTTAGGTGKMFLYNVTTAQIQAILRALA